MIKHVFQGIGAVNPLDHRTLPLNAPCYGVRIASDSEIDQVRLTVGGSPEAYQGASALDATLGTQLIGEVISGASSHKISVGHPHIARLNPDGGRLDLVLSPTRVIPAASLTGAVYTRAARLALEVAETPEEAMWFTSGRAPLDLDVTMLLSSTDRTILVPFYGRRQWSVELQSVTVSGSGEVTMALDARRYSYDANAGSAVQLSTWVLAAVSTGDQAWEGEGEMDFLAITLGKDTGTARAFLHIRGED